MTLKTVAISNAAKTKGCAVTYRAGEFDTYGTCPDSCALKPVGASGTKKIDRPYLAALLAAVPRNGVAWTYSHFPWKQWALPIFRHLMRDRLPTTTINFSAASERSAAAAIAAGIPTVLATQRLEKHYVAFGARFVRCPATVEGSDVNCGNCGGAINGRVLDPVRVPLCARIDRDYVITFPAHGPSRKRVGTGNGGCYASGGNVRLHWNATAEADQHPRDETKLASFVDDLPRGTVLRHHVAGDIGATGN